jgi:hypothetical protein
MVVVCTLKTGGGDQQNSTSNVLPIAESFFNLRTSWFVLYAQLISF